MSFSSFNILNILSLCLSSTFRHVITSMGKRELVSSTLPFCDMYFVPATVCKLFVVALICVGLLETSPLVISFVPYFFFLWQITTAFQSWSRHIKCNLLIFKFGKFLSIKLIKRTICFPEYSKYFHRYNQFFHILKYLRYMSLHKNKPTNHYVLLAVTTWTNLFICAEW